MRPLSALLLVLLVLPVAFLTAIDDKTEMRLKIAVGAGTLIGVGFAVYKGLDELARARLQRNEEIAQRQREYRHKQALYARNLIAEVFGTARAAHALHMLDWLKDEYKDLDGTKYIVCRAKLQHSLRVYTGGKFDHEEWFIRNCFEALYNQLEQIERLIVLEIVRFEDLETAFRYYMRNALRSDIVHLEFLDRYDYPQAKAFLLRFKDQTGGTAQTRGPEPTDTA